jgi:hypothetical protein
MKKNNIFNGFMIFVAIACLLTFTLNMINGRFDLGDFRVYYSAARNLIFGGPVYMVSFDDGSGFYKYSPTTLFFFMPYIIFNFKVAEIIHFFVLGTIYWYTMICISKLINNYFLTENIKHEVWLLSISFACILIHFSRELFLGNINIILVLLCCFSIRKFLIGKDLQGSILLGIVILAKPYFLFLLLPLVLRKKWKALVWLLVTISCGLIIPFIYPGPQKSISLYSDWIKSILNHQGDFPGMTSISYLCNNIVPSWPSWGIFVIFALISMLASAFILNNIYLEKQQHTFTGLSDMNFIFEWFFIIALLPNLIKTDWVLMLFNAPLITFIIFYIASKKQYWWIPILIILLFFYSANSDDLLGRALSHKILESGLMGLSNFLLVVVSLIMFLNLRTLLPFSQSSSHTSHESGQSPGTG